MNDVKKNIALNTFGTIIYCFAQWIITVLVVRLSSYESAGYLSLAMTTSSSFSVICLFGMRNYQISDVRGDFSPNEYVGSRFLTCIIAYIICAIVAFAGNSMYQVLCIDAFMLIRVAEAIVDVTSGEDQKIDRYDIIGISFLMRGIVTVISFTISIIILKDLLITLVIMAICNLTVALLYDYRVTARIRNIKPIIYSSRIKKLMWSCVPVVVYSFLMSTESLIARNVLQQMYGTEKLGIYSSIASPTMVVQVFASVAITPLLPQLSLVFEEKRYDEFLNGLHKIYGFLVGLFIVINIGAMILGHWGLQFLYGKEILNYYYLFMPIVWSTLATASVWILSSIVVALRRTKMLIVGMVVDFILCIALVYVFLKFFGLNGASYIQILCYALYAFFLAVVCEMTVLKSKKENNVGTNK